MDSNMPAVFKDLQPPTRCIIDATEVFIQRPQNPTALQLTFSSYKNHNTFEGLIAISPSGAICFISDIFGSNISDKKLTAECRLLEYLEEGDSAMAHIYRGFNISELLDTKGVALNILTGLDQSGQLSELKLIQMPQFVYTLKGQLAESRTIIYQNQYPILCTI